MISRVSLCHRALFFLLSAWLALVTGATAAPEPPPADWWVTRSAEGEPRIHLYFFWSLTCPHCRRAHPFVASLTKDYPWLELHSLEISADMGNALRYLEMARALDRDARSIPAFLACGNMVVGYDNEAGVGRYLRNLIETCHQRLITVAETETHGILNVEEHDTVQIPLFGTLDASSLSLPVLTLVLAGLDAFNPCAFFVLLFLLSLLVHARDRRRMALIGGIFVFFSGFIYFIFMAAWLNVFLLLGELQAITWIAGLVAVSMGVINVKDYFRPQAGPSLSISDQAKPNLFRRMRGLLAGQRLFPLVIGAITLAIAANSYELLCTAGFPMVYTRALTLNELPTAGYYFYLALYNVVYVVPLLIILTLFTLTLGSRKLQEHEGRTLKLLSGTMMLGLGLVLLAYPDSLANAGVAVLLLAAALLVTAIVVLVERTARRKSASGTGR
jgi:hypothetical protein